MNSVELREARAKALHDAKSILAKADAEKRDMTREENAEMDAYYEEADRLELKILTEEKRQTVERAEASLKESKRKTVGQLAPQTEEANYREALRCWLLNGTEDFQMSADRIDNAARCGVRVGTKSLTVSKRTDMNKTDTPGSVGWKEFFGGFAEELKAYAPVMGLISYHQSSAGVPLPIPVMDDTANKAAILAEGATSTQAIPSVTSVTLGSFKYESKEVPLTLEVIQDSSVNLEAYVAKAISERFARAWAEHITVGTGSGQPYGIVTRASNSSVVATGTTSAPTFTGDMLIDLAESLDDAYRFAPGVGYMMAPATIAKIRKLKDSNGQYLWQPSLQAGNPATFYGHPVFRNQHMATSGASARLIVFGDFSKYTWRNVGGVEIHRLNELRILDGMISYQSFARADGNLILPNSVKYLAGPAS